MSNQYQLDGGSAQGFLLSVTLISFGKMSEYISNAHITPALQNTAYTLSALVALDTLLGGRIKKFIARLFK